MSTHRTKSRAVAVTQAKKLPADGGAARYYYSRPPVIAWWDLRGHLWYFRALARFRREHRIHSLPGLFQLWFAAVFTQAGQDWVVDKVQEEPGGSLTVMKWVAWGTGSTAEAVGNTALHVEASEARVVGVLSQPAADVDRCVGTITANGTKTITECGRFNQLAVGGTLYVRSLFTGIPMVLDDRIEFTQDLQVT